MSISKRLRSKIVLGNSSKPYARRTFRGVTLENRTISALKWAEERYLDGAPRKRQPWRLGQGSFSQGSLSAGTHAGGGTFDVMFAGLNAKQRKATVKWLKKAGFAVWAREGAVWGTNNDHAHAVLMGHRTLSKEAKEQADSYRAHRDGLAGNNYDPTWRPNPIPRWSHAKNRPIKKHKRW